MLPGELQRQWLNLKQKRSRRRTVKALIELTWRSLHLARHHVHHPGVHQGLRQHFTGESLSLMSRPRQMVSAGEPYGVISLASAVVSDPEREETVVLEGETSLSFEWKPT